MLKKIQTLRSHVRFIYTISYDIKSLWILSKVFIKVVVLRKKTPNETEIFQIKIRLNNGLAKTIYLRSCDYFILYEIFELKVYESFVQTIKSKSVILDLGGHIGFATIYLRDNLDNRIVTFEPSERNLKILRKNLDGVENVEIRKTAIGDSMGEVDFHIYPDSPSRNSLLPEQGGRTTTLERVQVVTLDSILEEYPDCGGMKFDIEGAEKIIFSPSLKKDSLPIIMGEIKETTDFTLSDFLSLFKSHTSQVTTINKTMHLVLLTRN